MTDYNIQTRYENTKRLATQAGQMDNGEYLAILQRYELTQQLVKAKVKQLQQQRLHNLLPSVYDCGPLWRPLEISDSLILYKVVAVKDRRLVSVFDASTEYHLGCWLLCKRGSQAWPPVDACFTAFTSPQQAADTRLHPRSKGLHLPRVLLKLETIGRAYARNGTTYACSTVKPLHVIGMVGLRRTD